MSEIGNLERLETVTPLGDNGRLAYDAYRGQLSKYGVPIASVPTFNQLPRVHQIAWGAAQEAAHASGYDYGIEEGSKLRPEAYDLISCIDAGDMDQAFDLIATLRKAGIQRRRRAAKRARQR
jgi:hypothetical protein